MSNNVLKELVTKANEQFHDLFADNYNQKHEEDIFFPENQARIDKNLKILSEKARGGVLVDVGCGTGNVLKLARDKFNTLIGVDISEKSLQKASIFSNKTIKADIYNIKELEDNSISAITGYSVLHHLYDPLLLFRECNRLLKPGGFIYFDNDPNFLFDKVKIIGLSPFLQKVFPKGIKIFIKYCIGKSIPSNSTVVKKKYDNLVEENRKIYQLAEFHHHFSNHGHDGFDISQMKRWLEKEGFCNIKMFLVNFDISAKKVWQKPDSYFRRFYYSHFCFFAKKKN